MGTITSNIHDKIKLYGSYEAYLKHCEQEERIPYFPDPEEVPAKPAETVDYEFSFSGIRAVKIKDL